MAGCNNSIIRRAGWVVFVIGAAAMLLAPVMALARAGGGGGYSGGGGGGGDAGDILELIILVFRLIQLCIEVPVLGIPLTIGLIGLFVYAGVKGKDIHTSRTIRRGAKALDANRKQVAILQLQRNDPAFNEANFNRRVEAAFVKIQYAWARQDLGEVRAFISDGICERFTLQFDEQREFGYRNFMDQVQVKSIELADVQCGEVFDELSVRITASAIDYRVGLTDNRMISGNKSPQKFVEYWSYLRRRGAKTRADRLGLMENHCPNCGAAIAVNQSANCAQCGSLLRSGEHDWVLAEITQECEWAGSAGRNVPGFARMAEKDPQFSLQHLEDLASVVFWRKAMADRKGDVRPLRKMASAEYCERFERGIKGGDGRAFYADCAVGSVDTIGIIPGEELDRALVEVRWSGTRYVIDKGQALRTSQTTVGRSLFVLARKAGVQSKAERAISSAHCPSCGAPESRVESNACEFCGQVLNDGTSDWMLNDTLASGSSAAKALMAELGSKSGGVSDEEAMALVQSAVLAPADLMAWMVHTMVADGQLTAPERQLLLKAAKNHGVGREHVDRMLSAATAGELRPPEPRNSDEGRAWLEEMTAMALADGQIQPEEQVLLEAFGRKIGLSGWDLQHLVQRKRKEMYAAARRQLRQRTSR